MTVTAELDATVAKLTRGEAKILAHFAAGDTVDATARAAGVPDAEVVRVIQQVGRNNRSYARTLTLAWQREHPAGPPAPTRPPVRVGDAPAEDGITNLLSRAIATDVPKLMRAADRISNLVDQLEAQVREYEQGKELRTRAEELERELAEIRRQLAPKRTGSVLAGATADDRVSPRLIRAWATDAGVDCPIRGRIPNSVMDAYREAVANA